MYKTPSDVLANDGPFVGLVDNYSARDMQIEMAEMIADAINEKDTLICEAGTGTGKTFAYLIPALLSGRKVVISTGTKHLQDQIFQKDLPAVLSATGLTTSVSVLKGRSNYLCLDKYKRLDSTPISNTQMAEIRSHDAWVQSTKTGDLTEILTEQSPLQEHITSSTDNCLGQSCDYYEDCYVLRARRRAQETDVIIVNHYLLLSDMTLKETGFGELLPEVDSIIFDEAHLLPELASQYFGVTVSSRQIQELVKDAAKAYANEAADMPGFNQLLVNLEQVVIKVRAAFGNQDQRVDWRMHSNDQIKTEAMALLEAELLKVSNALSEMSERGRELENCFKRIVVIQQRLDTFLHDDERKMVTWVELRGRGFLLHQTPLNIAEEFQSRLKSYDCASVYTSATLTVSNNFQHYSDQLGLHDALSKTWPSPYDYKKQTLLYLPEAMPHPGSREYTEKVVEQSLPVLKASQGRAFMLFTSYRALNLAAELMEDQLPYTLLVQGDQSRMELLETFRHDEHSILLGTNSFWEGVDVKGPSLSCVIIDKLPFATPDDPVLKARATKMEEAGRNPFMEHQVPLAVIQLKQGIGRLIRDEADRGVLMICDPRLTEKSYGKVFLRSLPDMTMTRSIEPVKEFFK